LATALGIFVLLTAPSPPSARAAFGFESLSSTFGVGGGASGPLLAGSHPESWTTTFALNAAGPPEERYPDGALKDLRVELPTGLVALPTLLPKCSRTDFTENACPASTAVGSIEFASPESPAPAMLFLLEPVAGQAAQLGLHVAMTGFPDGQLQMTVDVSVAPGPPYNLIASITNISQVAKLFGATLKLEGAPDGTAFLTLPRSCGQTLQTSFAAFSWQDPGSAATGTAPDPQAVVGCEGISYSPSFAIAPTTSDVSSPSGLDVILDVPDTGISSVDGRAVADTESANLSLPPGLTINPPVAAGMTACTIAQSCPEASKIGNASVTTPLFSQPVLGSIYVGVPEGSTTPIATGQSASRLALYLVLRDTERGLFIALPLRVDADSQTGRLTISFDQIPQLPITHLEVHLNSGPRAPLATSATCGAEAIAYSLTPSSGNPAVRGAQSFATSGSDCGARFAPTLSAGTTSNAAGRSSAFVFELSQGAAASSPSAFSVTLPPGLSAAFGTVTPCPDSQAGSGGCPASSKVGYARVALGSGPEPLWVPPGEEPDSAVYLAGPYKGAPYSFVIVVPGQAGPFDLGTVVLRAPITIDPTTARASLGVEGLPQILDGVPLHYRTIRVVLDRPGFIHNPTSCEAGAITGTARSADGSSAAISSRFQAADCGALSFEPKLSLRLSGAVRRNGHPAMRAVLRGDSGGAAVSSASIALPADELLDLHHLRGLCPRDIAADRCPRSSLLGNLRLTTSLLGSPLEGQVYLRVPRRRLPELSAEVHSGGLSFVVDGRTTDANGRFGVKLESLPDIPLTEAVLNLPGGRKGIVVNSRSLCGSRQKVAATFTAHNGMARQLRLRPSVQGC
jgi:hypothetical protein